MSTHKVPFEMYQSPLSQMPHKATTGNLVADRNPCYIPVDTTAGAAALTLVRPTKAGIFCSVILAVDNGDLTLTVTGGYNFDEATSITFDDAGDFVMFYSIDIGGTLRWQAIAQEGTNVAVETGLFDAATITALTLDATLLTVTGAELNQLDATVLTAGSIMADMAVTAGVGITGTADNYASKVEKIGTLFKTTIVIDIDGLNCGGANDDIIGADGAGVAHLGQITAARSGTIFAGTLTCIEAPTGGDEDIDLHSATEATGVEDTAISALTETKLCNSGNLAAGSVIPLTAYPAANEYLYLTCGTFTDATYTAGILVIELWGK